MAKINKTLFMFLIVITVIIQGCVPEKSAPSKKLPTKQNELHPKEINFATRKLDEIMKKARQGMILESTYNVIDSTIKQVKAEWGEPDNINKAGNGIYATYNKEKVAFGYSQTGEIFDIRSYAKDLNGITSTMIEKTLGKPTQIREINNESIFDYVIDANKELKFIIPNKGKGGVDHISVINPDRIKADETSTTSKYILDIKGRSNQLSTKAWENMQAWRKQIVLFSQGQESVFVNGPNKRQVALTFDDGPDNKVTPAIIDILDKYNVKGNFFFIGRNVNSHPEIVRKAYDKGNLVLSHSYNHVELTKLEKGEIEAEIDKGGKAIKSVIGKEPAILRPPYGETNEQVALTSHEAGYSIVLWSTDTLDWSQKEAENIVKNVISNVRNGEIILMHSDSDKSETQKALPLIIKGLQEKNFEIVDLETLLNVSAYK